MPSPRKTQRQSSREALDGLAEAVVRGEHRDGPSHRHHRGCKNLRILDAQIHPDLPRLTTTTDFPLGPSVPFMALP